MSSKRLAGVFAAIITPVDRHGGIDAGRFISLAEYLLDNGCDGLNVLGTTGEATSFSLQQRVGLMREVANTLPQERMMVGTGAAAVGDAVRLTQMAAELGFSGALMLPPFYYKGVLDDGVVAYFKEVITATRGAEIPIYLYNFPALSGIQYTHDLISRLISEFGPRIAGLKDSSGDMDYARQEASRPDFDVFPSNEATLSEARDGVFAGCISATVNITSKYCAAAFHDGDSGAQKSAVNIRALFNGTQLVPAVKAVVAHVHGQQELAHPMPPFVPLPQSEIDDLSRSYDALVSQV